jgi:pimeloyl-ACP methyl ester carboxylesterase
MGRSWGGFASSILAAKHGENFGMINLVVPVIDLKDMFENGWFGRIAHSDFAPEIDQNGDYILDETFHDRIAAMNPVNLVSRIPAATRINLLTNGLDDRVDQGGEQEVNFAKQIEAAVNQGNFHYHRSIMGNHSNRYYQVLMFSLIAENYGLTYDPMPKN